MVGAVSPTRRLVPALIASLTLGLAPFAPEPHVVGKVRWLLGGGGGMGPTDIFDLAMHAAPWIWLLVERGLSARAASARRRV